MFSNYQFKYGTVREFGEIIHAKINNAETDIGTFDFSGKNKTIRFENLKKLVTDFLVSQNIKFTEYPARVNITTGGLRTSKDTVIWSFKLNSVECFALIAIGTDGEVEGLVYGRATSNGGKLSVTYTEQGSDLRTYENVTMSKKYVNEIFIKDFYYFLKHFGEFKESYENFKNKKKLKNAISLQSSIALLSRLVKNYFDISVIIQDGFIETQRYDVPYGENKLTVAFDGSVRLSSIQLRIRVNGETIYAGLFEFSTEKEIMKSTTKINNLAAFLNIVKGA